MLTQHAALKELTDSLAACQGAEEAARAALDKARERAKGAGCSKD